MSFDGFTTHCLVQEFKDLLKGGRINKIYQPYEQELVLVLRSQGKTHKLLLSAHPQFARMQLSQFEFTNPNTPPNFLQLARKLLEGGILEDITQIENDRIAHFRFSKRNELGDLENILLIVELMGRHSNILLVNKESMKILDAIKHVGFSQNSYRTILPGSTYLAPPKSLGGNPFQISKEEEFKFLQTTSSFDRKAIQEAFQGFGGDTAIELSYLLNKHPLEKSKVWTDFISHMEQPAPTITSFNGKEMFTPFPFETLHGEQQSFATFSEMLDTFYLGKAEKDRVKQQAGDALRKVENELQKNRKKMEKFHRSIEESEHAEKYRQFGELLTTYLAQIPRGEKSVKLQNYYSETMEEVEIPLNEALTPNQNAQKYFQKYQKLKAGVRIIHEQMEKTEQEIAYLESLQMQLENATPIELPSILEELYEMKILRKRTSGKKKKEKPSSPDVYYTTDGTRILVGKNNLQNDRLTTKTADKNHFWLHAKNIPGSHVILESANPSDEAITEAGVLAAYFSKFRHSNLVPVDLLPVKKIKKPNGAKPGYVIYTGQKTIHSIPDEEIVKQLRMNSKENGASKR